MSLRFRYFLFIGILHILMAIGLFYLLKEDKIYFLLSEALLLISFGLGISLYKKLIRPIELMQTGANALTQKDFTIKYVKTGASEVDKLIEVYNTMIDTLRQEQTRTVEQSYFLEKLIQASPIGIIIMDFDGNIADINPTAMKILSIENDSKGKSLGQYNHVLIPQIHNIKDGEKKLLTVNGYNKYRCQVDVVIHKGFPRKFILLNDLTAEILESEKEAYGKVIRMVAHEVNNSMGAINSILNTVVEYGFKNEDSDSDLKESLIVAIERNNSLSKFINNFADIIRLPLPTLSKHELNKLILNASKPYESIASKKNIRFTYKMTTDTIAIHIDAAQIERVISNALKNAIESIKEEGEIIISSRNDPRGFSIIDNGPGITSDVVDKLFTPFYSTKTNGQGIGLMLCREIIENHSGTLTLATKPEDGRTYFSVIL